MVTGHQGLEVLRDLLGKSNPKRVNYITSTGQ